MTKKCTQCKVEQGDDQFLCKNNRNTLTCSRCRDRSLRCNNKNKDERTQLKKTWQENNKEYVKLYNEFYRNHAHLPQEERELILQELKKTHGIEDRVKGIASAHRKKHIEMDGIKGKKCSVPECGWKPLTDFNFSSSKWDKLRTTCKACLAKKRKKFSSTFHLISRENILYRLNTNIRGRILMSIHDKKLIKNQKIIHHLGCTIETFRKHIESTFTKGMSWNKYGHYIDKDGIKQTGFHIDHIIPCAAFDLNDPYQLLLCFHWKNCRAMWGNENMSKGCKFEMEDKIKYIENQKDIISREKAEKLVQDIMKQIELEKEVIDKAIKDNELKYVKQQELYKTYIHDQCLEAVRIMFFMYENKIHEKSYKSTPIFIMKNRESRRSGAENPMSKRVCKLSLDGTLLGIYESMNMAAIENKTFHASVSKCCTNPDRLFASSGFRWCFEDNLDGFQHRARLSIVLKQLTTKIPRYREPKKKQEGRPQTDEIRKKIAESMKKYNETEESREKKRKALEKRAETMNARIRASITEKNCRLCNQTLPVSSFCKKAAAADGLQSYCKQCVQTKKKVNSKTIACAN